MTEAMFALLVLGNLAPTLMMTGLIWFVQIVHYPLFDRVDAGRFPAYERDHTGLTTLVVGPLMLLEGVCAAGLLFAPEELAPGWAVWSGFALLLMLWGTTAAVQVPCHNRLTEAFDAAVHRRLVRSNWLRTVAWSARSGLAMYLVWMSLR